VNSLRNQTYTDFTTFIIFDNNDVETYNKADFGGNIKTYLVREHLYVAGCWNWFTKNCWEDTMDGMVWLCDDIELYSDCLEQAVSCYNKTYKDFSGVVGLTQECPGHPEYTWKPYGQCILGKDFINLYPERQVCCPDYKFLYQDEEMYKFANYLNSFVLCENAKLKHYHPSFMKEEVDETHIIGRVEDVKARDTKVYLERKRRGLVWGKTYELITKGSV